MEPRLLPTHSGGAVPRPVIGRYEGLAALLRKRVGTLANAMVSAYQDSINEYRDITDESLIDDVRAVSAATVRCCLNAMQTGELRDEDLAPLLEGARRRAVQGIDREAVLRAYRVGVQVLWREVTGTLAVTGTTTDHDLASLAAFVLEFADRVSTEVAAAYADQALRDGRTMAQRHRTRLFDAVLAGTVRERHREVGAFRVKHCVMVAEMRGDAPFADLEEVGRMVVGHAGALFWTVRHRSVIAALEMPGRGRDHLVRSLAELPTARIAGIGLGHVAEGAGQTRLSYGEALDALRVGVGTTTTASAAVPVYDHRHMAPLIAMLDDLERARRFADAALAPLAPMMDRRWVIPTVDAYLSHGGRLKEVASVLSVHQNTVKYRINGLRPFIDLAGCGGEQSATLLLAVRVHLYLSTVVNEKHE